MRRKIVFIIAAIVFLFVVYNFLGRILVAFKASERLTSAVDRLHNLQVKNQELKNQLTEVTSPNYIEKQARDKLGLAKEGETLIVIPEEKIQQVLGLQKNNFGIDRLPNWQGWLRLFFK